MVVFVVVLCALSALLRRRPKDVVIEPAKMKHPLTGEHVDVKDVSRSDWIVRGGGGGGVDS